MKQPDFLRQELKDEHNERGFDIKEVRDQVINIPERSGIHPQRENHSPRGDVPFLASCSFESSICIVEA